MPLPYHEGRCYLDTRSGRIFFESERDLEKHVIRCVHATLYLSADGFYYCADCRALPVVKRD